MKPLFDTIQQTQALPPGQDYAQLRTEGLALVQELSGELWTDYNLHDPGVTLLEALCYVLTDLSSRASQPIPNLLAVSVDTPVPADALVPAHEAFANHPVTCHDYEKLLLDRFDQLVKNAWVSQLSALQYQPDAPGHYQVKLELQPSPVELTAAAQQDICRSIGEFLNSMRNLGEVFTRPIVLQPREIIMSGSLDLLPGYHPERVLANVLAVLAEALAPHPVSDSLTKLRGQGLAAEDIFAGPVTQNRLLMEKSFPNRRVKVELSELLPHVALVDGIRHLSQFRLYYTDANGSLVEPELGQLPIADDEIPRLKAPDSFDRLVVSQQGVPLRPNRSFVLEEFERLSQSAMRPGGTTGQRPDQMHFINLPGTYLNVGRYDSVQHLFPALYGVGLDGPPVQAGAEQRAAIMQLKGYLLHFEQPMADFCARLENIGQFFSIAPPTVPDHALLYDVPFVAPLLAGTEVSPNEAWYPNPAADARWEAYRANPFNPYARALQPTAGELPDRRHQRYVLLTHLLARFGYTVQLQPPPEIAQEDVQQYLIGAYEQLLLHLNTATYNRARARLPLVAAFQPTTEVESGLEFFLFLLTGLESIPRRWSQQESLEELEAQVQWNESTSVNSRLALRIRFDQPVAQPLPEVLALFRAQLLSPEWRAVLNTLTRSMPPVAGLVPAATEAEWLFETPMAAPDPTPADATAHLVAQLRRYGQGLGAKLIRVGMLDHLVLKPWPALDAIGAAQEGDYDFFHCQITVFLPAYAPAYCSSAGAEARDYAEARAYVEDLVQQYTPAHVLVNTVWLSYGAMREWETLYAILVPASGLLNANNQSAPTLRVIQAEVMTFLRLHLVPVSA